MQREEADLGRQFAVSWCSRSRWRMPETAVWWQFECLHPSSPPSSSTKKETYTLTFYVPQPENCFSTEPSGRDVKAAGLGVQQPRGVGGGWVLPVSWLRMPLCTELCRNGVKPPASRCLYWIIFKFCYRQMKEFSFLLLLFCFYCYSIAFLYSNMRSLTEWKLLSILDAQVPYTTFFL